MQNGGCHPGRRLPGRQRRSPARSSSTWPRTSSTRARDQTILPPYEIEKVGNAKIAFIGLTLEGTPLIVTPAGVAGLEFRPEVQTVNALVDKLRERAGRARVRRPDPPGRPAERAVRQRLHGRQPLRQLHRCDQADRRRARPAGRPRDLARTRISRTSATSAARYVTSASSFGRADHGHRPDDRPPDEGRHGGHARGT